MPATEPDGIVHPGDGLYNYSADMAATASSVQTALNRRANAWRGTGAERAAFLNEAPEGALWTDNDGNKVLHMKRNGKWWPEIEYQQVGSLQVSFGVTEDALAITNFGRVAHLNCRIYQTADYYFSAKTGHPLATFDDRWAPRTGRVTTAIGMEAGYDLTPKPDQYLLKYIDVVYLPSEWSANKTRILIYNPTASSNQFTTVGRGAELSLSLSWPLPY